MIFNFLVLGKENSLLFLLVLFLSISITIVLDLGWRIEEILFQSHPWISLFIYCNWIFVSVTCFSSTFLAIYNSLAIVLVGSRKALRSRLGYLVSWVLRSTFFNFNFLVSLLHQAYFHFHLRSGLIESIFYISVCWILLFLV